MTNENARNGIGKVFVGEILQIVAAFCTLLTIIPVMGPMIGGMGSGLVGIIGVIIMLVGLGKAGKENARFKTAFILMIVTLILGFVMGGLAAFLQVTWMTQAEQIVSTVFMLIVTYNVLFGCAEINSELSDKASNTWRFYMIVVILDIALTIVAIILVIMGITEASLIASAVLVILDVVFDLIAYFKYLGFLKTAKNTL